MTMSSTIQEVVLEFLSDKQENKMFVIIQRGNLQAL